MIVGAANTLSGDSNAIDGSAGFLLAVCLLLSGILVLASKKSRGTLITAIVFYTLGGLIGLAGAGIYQDLVIWSVISLIFARLLLVFQIIKPKRNKLGHKIKTTRVNRWFALWLKANVTDLSLKAYE